MKRIRSIVLSSYRRPSDSGAEGHGSERTIDAGAATAHRIYSGMNRRTGSALLDPMCEQPQKLQVVHIEFEAGLPERS